MGYATLAQARQFVAPASGECDKDELTAVVNQCRHRFYLLYQEMQLFADVVECYAVEHFNTHGQCFQGITLGREVASIEAMWWNEWPVQLRSSWREWQAGISPYCACGLEKFDLAGMFSTVRDLKCPNQLIFRCDSPLDAGKTLTLRGMSPGNAPLNVTVTLGTDPQVTADVFSSIDHQGGVVKAETMGRVVLTDQFGRLLGIYEPDETVPSYRRVKITGLPTDCGVVNVRSARRYFPLSGDDDVVETDNAPAFDAMARYLRSYQKSGASQDDLKIAAAHLVTAKGHLLGDKAREQGKGTQASMRVHAPSMMPRGRRLTSSTGRWPW